MNRKVKWIPDFWLDYPKTSLVNTILTMHTGSQRRDMFVVIWYTHRYSNRIELSWLFPWPVACFLQITLIWTLCRQTHTHTHSFRLWFVCRSQAHICDITVCNTSTYQYLSLQWVLTNFGYIVFHQFGRSNSLAVLIPIIGQWDVQMHA